MDVLRPPVLWVNGRCYRKLPFEQTAGSTDQEETYPKTSYQENMSYEDEMCDAFGLVEETDRGYRTAVNVPSTLFKFIIGRKGETKRRMERETNTQIHIPKMGQTGDIVILGSNRSEVLSARSRVEVVVESSRLKIPFTHFLSFPLYFDGLVKKIQEFKTIVLHECSKDKGIDPSIFQLPSKLHLTIGMLVLLSEDEVEKAAKFLTDCYQDLVRESLGGEPVSVELKGVEYMNDDPADVHVLYAKVVELDGTNRLQRLADSIMEKFVECGLMQREYDRVKLHATVMNSKLRITADDGEPVATKRSRTDITPMRVSFDASNIVQLFTNFSFGEHHLDRIHISQRGAFDADGHYHCSASVPLP